MMSACGSTQSAPAATSTTPIQYRDWSDVTQGDVTKALPYDGTVVPSGAVAVQSAASGTITRLPGVGSAISAGDPLFFVDEQPVIAMAGQVPVYRDLLLPTPAPAPAPSANEGAGGAGESTTPTPSSSLSSPTPTPAPSPAPPLQGGDVAQLETFLAAAGHYGGAVDGQFGPGLAAAAQHWRKDHQMSDAKGFAAGELVFLPGAGPWTVTKTEASIGQAFSGGAVLDVSSAAPAVQVSLDGPPPADVTYSIAADAGSGRAAVPLSINGPAVRDDSGKYVQTLTITGPPPAGLAVGTALVVEQAQLLARGAVSVPVAAVRLDATGATVVACRSSAWGRARTCPVTLGATDGTSVAVTDGLSADEQVAVGP